MDNNRLQTRPSHPDHSSYQRHKKQQFWQILVPIFLGILLMVAVMVFAVLTATQGDTGSRVSGWADVSMIWLILPVMMAALLVAVLLFALVYLLARALRVLPVYTGLVQQYAALAADKVKNISNKLVSPIMSVRSSMAAVNKIFERFNGHKNR